MLYHLKALLREIINDGENGILIPKKDPVALRSVIERVIKRQGFNETA